MTRIKSGSFIKVTYYFNEEDDISVYTVPRIAEGVLLPLDKRIGYRSKGRHISFSNHATRTVLPLQLAL